MSMNREGITNKRSVGGSPLPQKLGRQTSSSCRRGYRGAKGGVETGMTALGVEAASGESC